MLTPDRFRELFPAFASVSQYPDPAVEFFISLAGSFISKRRWPADLVEYGTGVFVAHHLSIQGKANAKGVATPGATGLTQSKSVHDVSVSYDTQIATDMTAGHWNLTSYGLQWWGIVQMVGAGPVQIPASAGPYYGINDYRYGGLH